jgi:UDP-4-amino-4,6-dideoxy-L-N-acetyl-beta-L-altrosamine transaminase
MKIYYGRQSIDNSDIQSIVEASKSEKITQGIFVSKFENSLKKKFKSKYCSVVSNGTAALYLAIKSLKLKKNSKIIQSPNTFLSSSYTIIMNDLVPDFSDIENQTYNLDLNKLEDKIKKDKKVKAIIAVDYAGHPCDWVSLNFLKKKYNIYLINDNCHSMGSKINNNVGYAVKYADLVTQSYHPVKNFTTGEGGSVLTNNFFLHRDIAKQRNHGIERSSSLVKKHGSWFYQVDNYGFNFRISDILCALGVSQLKKLNKFILKRNEISNIYSTSLCTYDFIQIPKVLKNYYHSFHLYPLLVNFKELKISKKVFFKKMQKKNIFLQVHYIPVHTQPFLKKYGFRKGQYPISESFYDQEVSLPIHYSLDKKKLEYILFNIKKYLK